MSSALQAALERFNAEEARGTAGIAWMRDEAGEFQVESAWGFGSQRPEHLWAAWQGNANLLNEVLRTGRMARATAQMTPVGGAARELSLVACLLPGNPAPRVLQLFYTDQEAADRMFQQGPSGPAWQSLLEACRACPSVPASGESSNSTRVEHVNHSAEFASLPEWVGRWQESRQMLPPRRQTVALLNQFCLEYDLARCSLFRWQRGECRLLGISGAESPEPRTATVAALQQLARLVCSKRPGFSAHEESDSDSTAENRSQRTSANGSPLQRVTEYVQAGGEGTDSLDGCHVLWPPPANHGTNSRESGTADSPRGMPTVRNQPDWFLLLESRSGDLPEETRSRLLRDQAAWWLAFSALPETRSMPGRWSRRLVQGGCLVLIVLGLLLPIPLTISAPGHFLPEARQLVFAPETGVIFPENLTLPDNGRVQAGQLLLTITGRELELEISQVEGRLATVNEQIRSLRSTRAEREGSPQERIPVERDVSIRLAELQSRQAGLQQERELLQAREHSLRVTSPIEGEILTWNARQQLSGRPVTRGEQLLSIGSTEGDWEVLAEVRDRDLQHFLVGLERHQGTVRLQAETTDGTEGTGQVREVSPVVGEPRPGEYSVRVRMQVTTWPATPRPGSQVRLLLNAGSYPAGYVWFRHAWAKLHQFWTW